MRVINLASGSDGNLTYLETDQAKVLVDMGLSCKEVVTRIALLGLSPEQIDGVIVTHEHLDHCKGADQFCSKYNKKLYAHRTVWEGLSNRVTKLKKDNRMAFEDCFYINDLKVNAFSVPHDVPCYGFSFENGGNKISILTDFGHTNERILESILGSQIVYLESNYDKVMLSKNERYPLVLKRRIAGPNGHLSNNDAAQLILYLALHGTRQVVLSHLSKDNNTPNLAFDTVCSFLLSQGVVEGMHINIDVAGPMPGVMFKLK